MSTPNVQPTILERVALLEKAVADNTKRLAALEAQVAANTKWRISITPALDWMQKFMSEMGRGARH